jgi:hypothetical protein
MTDLLSTGVAWLDEQRQAHLAQTVTYERDSIVSSVAVSATLGSTEYDVLSDGGDGTVQSRAHSVDFLIAVADLADFGTPDVGDKITHGSDIYRVTDLGGTGHVRYADPHSVVWRIHTKRTET